MAQDIKEQVSMNLPRAERSEQRALRERLEAGGVRLHTTTSAGTWERAKQRPRWLAFLLRLGR